MKERANKAQYKKDNYWTKQSSAVHRHILLGVPDKIAWAIRAAKDLKRQACFQGITVLTPSSAAAHPLRA